MNALIRDLSIDPDASRISDRELYYRLLDPEGFVDWVPAARDRIRSELSGWSTEFLSGSRLFSEPLRLDRKDFPALKLPFEPDLADGQDLLRQFAPAALLGQCWLSRYSQAANCSAELTAALFRVYQAGLDPEGGRSDVESYRVLLWQAGAHLPPIESRAFSEHEQLSEAAFRHALVRLCLARCAHDFQAELIGFTAAHVFGLSGIFDRGLIRRCRVLGISDHYWKRRVRAGSHAIGAVQDAVVCCLRDRPDMGSRRLGIEAGIRLYVESDRLFWSSVLADHGKKRNPADRVLALFRNKAQHGKGFHDGVKIGDRSLDAWLESGIQDGRAFLNALAGSKWFDLEKPGQSPFFTRVTAAGGVMAGVFTPGELNIVRDWLESRGVGLPDLAVSEAPVEAPRVTARSLDLRERGREARLHLKVRELYSRLVNVHAFPEVLPAASDYVEKCLRMARIALRVTFNPELERFAFNPIAFEERIHSIYRRQVDRYRPLTGEPRLDRDTWVFVIKQFAPTVLVDGCWLQNAGDPGLENCPVSRFFGRIYGDEVGNGASSANHPVIYRRLLESLGIDFPAIGDARFAHHRDFIPGAFDIPVYLLAVSQFPSSLLPELIGINLAIELSGLGGGYLRLAEALDYWGIDSTIVRVHQAADNLASGHSAIAQSAVSRYLDRIRSLEGERAMQNHWQRIWLGFVSIRIVPLRFIAHLAGHCLKLRLKKAILS